MKLITGTNTSCLPNFQIKSLNHSCCSDLVTMGLATKIQLAHPMGKGIIDGYEKRDQLVVLFGSNIASSVPKYRSKKNGRRK